MQVSTAEFRKGLRIVFDGNPYTIVDFQHVKPGKGGAFVRTKLKHMMLGKVIDNTFRSGEKVELVDAEDKQMQFLYKDDRYHFMDLENYEQVSLSPDEVGEARDWLKENTEVDVLYIGSRPVTVELPYFVELAIVKTDPGLRGAHRYAGAGGPGPHGMRGERRGAPGRRGGPGGDGDGRGADGRHLLPRPVPGRRAVRQRGRRRQGRPDPLHHRGDEADERDRVESERADREDLRRERTRGRVRPAVVLHRARGLSGLDEAHPQGPSPRPRRPPGAGPRHARPRLARRASPRAPEPRAARGGRRRPRLAGAHRGGDPPLRRRAVPPGLRAFQPRGRRRPHERGAPRRRRQPP